MASIDFSPWLKVLGLGGDQQNPAVMSQMAQQAAPENIGGMSRPAPQPSPQMPQVVPPPPERPSPYSIQPTTQPIGTLPQEIVPSQPAMAGPNLMDMYNRIEALKPRDNSQILREMAMGEKSLGESKMLQQKEVDKMKEGLAKYAGSERGIDFTPLAALSDAWYGGNLSQAAREMAPESAAKKTQNIQEMQGKIAAAQGEFPKLEMESLKNKLAQMGYMDERQNKLELAKIAAEAKLTVGGQTGAYQGKRLALQEKRIEVGLEKEARGSVNNDPSLKQYIPRLEGAAKIGELIHAAKTGKVVSNQALLGQVNAEIARLETGSQSPGLGQSEKTELQDAAAEFGALKDRIIGKPTDAVHPEVLDAAGKLVTELSGSYTKGIDSRFGTLKAGATPEQRAIMDAKHQDLKKTYAPRIGGWSGLQEMVTVSNGHETMQIPREDLAHAVQDGFKEQ